MGWTFKIASSVRDATVVGERSIARSHLRVVSDDPSPTEDSLSLRVRAVRRDVGRLLRALQASGRSIASWPNEVVTRLAHVDAVTARHLIDSSSSDPSEIAQAIVAMRRLEEWVRGKLSRGELARVHEFALMIHINDDELETPLLRPDRSPEEESPRIAVGGGPRPHSLRAGLSRLAPTTLSGVCRRLGIRPLEIEAEPALPGRGTMEHAIERTLRDDHLLSILVATLSPQTHRLLAKLVRGEVDTQELVALERSGAQAAASGGGCYTVSSPIEHLVSCGLAFRGDSASLCALWVPVELQHRVDGVLRTFGI